MKDEVKADRSKEVELKLQLDEKTYREIPLYFPVDRPAVRQENQFFDTPDYQLMKHKWGLRLRKEDTTYFLTVKGPVTMTDNWHIRLEHEMRLEESEALQRAQGFTLASLPADTSRELLKQFGDLYVKSVISFTNQRQFFRFNDWILELDKTIIKGQTFYELEIEAGLEVISFCREKVEQLFKEHQWCFEPSTENKLEKAERLFLKI